MFDADTELGIESGFGRKQPGESTDAEAVLSRLVVEELGGERPVLRDVIGGGAHRGLQRCGAIAGELAVDGGEFVVFADLGGGPGRDGNGRIRWSDWRLAHFTRHEPPPDTHEGIEP